MILPIYLYGHPVLRKVSEDITKDYPDLKTLIANMWETMYDSEGIGLAAPQIGLNIRLIVIDVDVLADTFPELKGVKFTLINPHLAIPFPTKAIIYSKDLDNILMQQHFPVSEEEFSQLLQIIYTFINSVTQDITSLQKKRLDNVMEDMVNMINSNVLSPSAIDTL